MALASSVWTHLRRDQMQLRMEADVRRLLRRAANPFLLASCPLAQALCEATGIANPQAALRYAIDGAFAQGAADPRLRQMLLSSIDHGESAIKGSDRLEVSKRHQLRRRAKGVAIVALHIRRLIGVPQLILADDESTAAADPLETIAELVSSIEPAMASRLLWLNGPNGAASAGMLAMRGRADVGVDPAAIASEFGVEISLPLVTVLSAQAKEINGTQDGTKEELWPLFGRFGRDSVETPEMRFELEWLAFLRARQRGDARQMERVARNLKRLSLNRTSWLSRALLAQAEAKIRCALLPEALELLDEIDRRGLRNFAVIDLAYSSALRSEVLLQQGDDASAERVAAGSHVVLQNRHFAEWRCQTTIARACLRLRRPWNFEGMRSDLRPDAWDLVALAVERVRHTIAAGARDGAPAREVYDVTVRRGYEGLAARAAAALAAVYEPKTRERRAWSLRALEHLLAVRDRSTGCDLFPFDRDSAEEKSVLDVDDAMVDLVYAALIAAIPQLRPESKSALQAARTFVLRLFDFVVGAPSAHDVDETIHALDSAAPSFAQFLRHFADDAFEILDTSFRAIVAMPRRADAERRLNLAMRSLTMLIQPSDGLRRFLVG